MRGSKQTEIEAKEVTDQREKETTSREILYAPPGWFGLPKDTEEYITDSQDKPFLVRYVDGKIAGYMILNATNADCADVFVMDVKRGFHRMGIGPKLNATYETMVRKLGYTHSQVKTVQMGHYRGYDTINRFYLVMGCKEPECFPTLWDE